MKEEIMEIARSIRDAADVLGIRDALTPMGAIEVHGLAIKQSASEIASALNRIAGAISELTEALQETGDSPMTIVSDGKGPAPGYVRIVG